MAVTVTEDALQAVTGVGLGMNGGVRPASAGTPGGNALTQLPSLPQQGAGLAQNTYYGPDSSNGGLVLNYDGTVRGLLNQVAGRLGLGWRYSRGGVQIYYLDTRVFDLAALPGQLDVGANITNQSSGGSTGGGGGGSTGSNSTVQLQSGMNSSMKIEGDMYATVQEVVKSMISQRGSVSLSPTTRQLVVTDSTASLDRVEKYVESVNAIARRQVVLEVKLYSVEKMNSNGYSISWDAVWQSVSKQIGMSFNGSGDGTGGPSLGGAVLGGNGSPFSGSEGFLDALAKQGDVHQLTTLTSVTMSGKPVPLQVGQEISYVQSGSTTLVPNVGQQTSRTQGKVTDGLSMILVPFLSRSDEVALTAQITLNSLRDLRSVGDQKDANYEEVPLIDTRNVSQMVTLPSGATLVLTGFEQETLRSDARGLGKPGFTLLGGGKSKQRNHSTLVMLITPRIIS